MDIQNLIARVDTCDFIRSYIETMLWTEEDTLYSSGFSVEDMEYHTLETIIQDCDKFLLQADIDPEDYKQAGHDFWLTRNRHGCGFWDGDWPEEQEERLTKLSEEFGEFHIYIDDEDKIQGY
jgi:hypothetical protein